MKTNLSLVAVILFVISLTVLGTIYGAWLFYPLEVAHLELESWTGLEGAQLLANFHHLMDYLTNPLTKVLDMPDFPSSESGLKHFKDVKGLFHLTQLLALSTAWPAWSFLIRSWKQKSLWLYQRLWLGMILFPVMIAGLGVLVGFETFFTLFHHLLFPGDSSWLFNPVTDPVINALPANFFLHCFLLFLALYQLILLSLFFIGKAQRADIQR